MMIQQVGEFSPERIREGLERLKDAFDKEEERKTSNGSTESKTAQRA